MRASRRLSVLAPALACGLILAACGSSATGSSSPAGGRSIAKGNALSDQVAQTDLRTALAAARALYVKSGNFGPLGPAALRQLSTALTFLPPGRIVAAGASQVGVSNGGDPAHQTVTLAALSASGTCWYLVDVAAAGAGTIHRSGGIDAPGVWYGHARNGASSCAAPESGPPPGTSLSGGWRSAGF